MKPDHEGWFLYNVCRVPEESNPVHVTRYPGFNVLMFYDPPFSHVLLVNETDPDQWFGEIEWKKK